MPRPLRVDYPGAVHHVMNRGLAHQSTFFSDDDRIEFGRRLAAIHERFGVGTLAYCLMDNHFHLLLQTPDGGLPAAMQHLSQVYTRHTNVRAGRDGPLFRGRYHSIAVTTDSYLLCSARYIHRNALDVPGVTSPADYRWSSYRSYLGIRPAPPFLHTELLLALFGNDRNALRRLTEGADTARAGIRTLDDLVQRVQFAVALDDLRVRDDTPATAALRTVLIALSHHLANDSLGIALAEHLAFPSPLARREAVRRATRRPTDDRVSRVLRAVLGELGLDPAAA